MLSWFLFVPRLFTEALGRVGFEGFQVFYPSWPPSSSFIKRNY